jgi:hypothetical protein
MNIPSANIRSQQRILQTRFFEFVVSWSDDIPKTVANGIFQQLPPVPLGDTGKSIHTRRSLQTFLRQKCSSMKILQLHLQLKKANAR